MSALFQCWVLELTVLIDCTLTEPKMKYGVLNQIIVTSPFIFKYQSSFFFTSKVAELINVNHLLESLFIVDVATMPGWSCAQILYSLLLKETSLCLPVKLLIVNCSVQYITVLARCSFINGTAHLCKQFNIFPYEISQEPQQYIAHLCCIGCTDG